MMLHLIYPVLPPSSNKLYFRGTQLTAKARKYKEDFRSYMRRYLAEISEFPAGLVYAIHLRFYFKSLVNPTFNNPKVPPKKRAKTRYKKIDLDNRIKLLTDCVRDVLAIDDSHAFAGSQEKHQCAKGEPEKVEIYVQVVDPKLFGLAEEATM